MVKCGEKCNKINETEGYTSEMSDKKTVECFLNDLTRVADVLSQNKNLF